MKKLKELLKSNKGFTLIELITTMAILALFSGALYTLFFSGGQTFKIVHDSYKAQNEARIAMSYITVKIRQNDSVTSAGAIVEQNIKVIDDKHLRIKDPNSTDYWWIYPDTKQLMESKGGDTFPIVGGDVIADIEDASFSLTSSALTGANTIDITVSYKDGEAYRELKENITLRSEP